MQHAVWLSVVAIAAIILAGVIADLVGRRSTKPKLWLMIAGVVILSLALAFFIWCANTYPLQG
jgi:MFS family permease